MTISPEQEIECYRSCSFSTDKAYEYTYSTRKSFQYIPSLGRKGWRYFTTKGFTYAGKWLRSEHSGYGESGEYWEVFQGDDGTEKNVYWDYDATLCWRECSTIDEDITATVRQIVDDMIDNVEKNVGEPEPEPEPVPNDKSNSVSPTIHHHHAEGHSFLRCIFGNPSKCSMLDPAETTTMEPKYQKHPNIAEFWCFITSFFYGSSLLLYFVKEEDWFEGWKRELAGWPSYIHFSIGISVLVMICSAFYHASLFEVAGCIDCFFASFVFSSVTMSMFGIDILTQVGVLLGLGVLNLYLWRYSTRIALIVVGFMYPFAALSCIRMKSYYGRLIFSLISLGIVCFLLDRMGYAPLHSIWHILSGTAITVSLYYVIVNGTTTYTE